VSKYSTSGAFFLTQRSHDFSRAHLGGGQGCSEAGAIRKRPVLDHAHWPGNRLSAAKYDDLLAVCHGIEKLADFLSRFAYGNGLHNLLQFVYTFMVHISPGIGSRT
jgi:hypothetical protein